jgi:hypothetical protein
MVQVGLEEAILWRYGTSAQERKFSGHANIVRIEVASDPHRGEDKKLQAEDEVSSNRIASFCYDPIAITGPKISYIQRLSILLGLKNSCLSRR